MKRIIFATMMLLSFIGLKAQMDPMQMPLPLNPQVKHGVLPNGLTYYILHNEEPKNRANFYIAQKVGSTLETPEQLGLAHFLEHMAFNGTSHYPGHAMLDYLQSKGIRFGADINAYTGFDETVYNINNVPTNDQALMDSVLLVLYDWSGSILLEEDEIDAERGVIESEYIQGNNAGRRMFTAILPQLYEEYQYHQMPIGTMEVVKNFPPQVLRDYYKKWYRPDQQGIVIVGDFDADAMEAKVKELFSQIPMPENAAERIYPTISDNEKPIYVHFEDPELQTKNISVFFKFDRTPLAERNTLGEYLTDNLLIPMVESMINTRLSDYAKKPECPYSFASVSVGTYLVSSQKGAFSVNIVPKDDIESAFNAAMGIVAQACKTGFMGTEVQRTRDELLANCEKLYNERDKRNSENLGRELINNFTQNEALPGIEIEYQLISQLSTQIPEDTYNEFCKELLTPTNQIILVTQPKTQDLNIPEENAMFQAMSNVLNADYQPYVDEVITEPLLAKMPKAGKITSEKNVDEFGTKEYTLSNGIKVVVKPTDFSNDEILVSAFKNGGLQSYPGSDATDLKVLEDITEIVKVGPFTPSRLEKYFAGKKISLNYSVGRVSNGFNGSSTVKDLNSLFELYYALFTDVSADQESFDVLKSQYKVFLANQESNPMFTFQKKIADTLYPNNPMASVITLDMIDQLNYNKMIQLYKESVANASDYTFVIVGNVDEPQLKDLLCKYIASLPGTKKKNEVKILSPFDIAQGIITDEFDIKAENPAVYVFTAISQEGLPYNVENNLMISLLSDIIDNVFTATLREEMGGTYSPQCWSEFTPYTDTWQINWMVITNEEMQKAIRDRALVEFEKLLANGADAENFNKVRGAALMQYENNVRTNKYWLSRLSLLERGYNIITGQREAIENLTLDQFNNFIKTLYNGKNRIEVVGIAK